METQKEKEMFSFRRFVVIKVVYSTMQEKFTSLFTSEEGKNNTALSALPKLHNF